MHSFDDIQDQTISFSRSKDWETESILSDISDIDDGLRAVRYTQDRNLSVMNASTVFEENIPVPNHNGGGPVPNHFQCDSPGLHVVQSQERLSSRSDISGETDPQLIPGGSVDGADVSDYFWLEEVADLASV
jgi:hypothetical protein